MEVDNFDVLKKMCEQDQEGKYTKAYAGNTNFMDAQTGKDGWGYVKMAVDNKTIFDIGQNNNLLMMLMVYDLDEFKRVKAEMEARG
jgi:hypothetical protein